MRRHRPDVGDGINFHPKKGKLRSIRGDCLEGHLRQSQEACGVARFQKSLDKGRLDKIDICLTMIMVVFMLAVRAMWRLPLGRLARRQRAIMTRASLGGLDAAAANIVTMIVSIVHGRLNKQRVYR
jgi:hypothetical protein